MARKEGQKKKGGNKHSQNTNRRTRKYGLNRHPTAKAGKRKVYCPQYPHCIHRGR